MTNKQKLYLVKLAGGAANTPEQMQYYQRLIPPAAGSRRYRELPKAERQTILSARDKQQARGLARGNAVTATKGLLKSPSYLMRDIPTAKGGLENIPPRPYAHPFSKGFIGNQIQGDLTNTINRMGQNLPIMPSAIEREPRK